MKNIKASSVNGKWKYTDQRLPLVNRAGITRCGSVITELLPWVGELRDISGTGSEVSSAAASGAHPSSQRVSVSRAPGSK